MNSTFTFLKTYIIGAILSLIPLTAFAQTSPDDATGAVGCAGCASCGGVMIAIPILTFIVSVALLIWVAKDAKSRGDNAVLWMAVVFFLNLLGLLIYILARSKGNLVPCSNCGNQKLESAIKCPHCGAGAE